MHRLKGALNVWTVTLWFKNIVPLRTCQKNLHDLLLPAWKKQAVRVLDFFGSFPLRLGIETRPLFGNLTNQHLGLTFLIKAHSMTWQITYDTMKNGVGVYYWSRSGYSIKPIFPSLSAKPTAEKGRKRDHDRYIPLRYGFGCICFYQPQAVSNFAVGSFLLLLFFRRLLLFSHGILV